MQFCAQQQNSVFSNINETEKWWCKLDFKVECTVITVHYLLHVTEKIAYDIENRIL